MPPSMGISASGSCLTLTTLNPSSKPSNSKNLTYLLQILCTLLAGRNSHRAALNQRLKLGLILIASLWLTGEPPMSLSHHLLLGTILLPATSHPHTNASPADRQSGPSNEPNISVTAFNTSIWFCAIKRLLRPAPSHLHHRRRHPPHPPPRLRPHPHQHRPRPTPRVAAQTRQRHRLRRRTRHHRQRRPSAKARRHHRHPSAIPLQTIPPSRRRFRKTFRHVVERPSHPLRPTRSRLHLLRDHERARAARHLPMAGHPILRRAANPHRCPQQHHHRLRSPLVRP